MEHRKEHKGNTKANKLASRKVENKTLIYSFNNYLLSMRQTMNTVTATETVLGSRT